MRHLASIVEITDIEAIPEADVIVVAMVKDWKVIVKKDEFVIGDKVIYCEIDSFLPIKDEYEFLRKSSYKKLVDGSEGFRLKTIRLRRQISQGLILPLSVLGRDASIDEDVTEELGIIKYEPPIPAELAGKVKGNFPSWIWKTDEERIQSDPGILTKYANTEFVVTVKLDGASSTFYVKDGVFGVCSRNLDLSETEENSFWRVARMLKLEEKLLSLGKNICIQGELIGPGIQKNPYLLKEIDVRFFNVFDIDTASYYAFDDFVKLINDLGLQTVPILDTNFKLLSTVDEMLTYAEGKSSLNPNVEREGIVVRSKDSKRISFKCISNKFLIKEKD